MRVVFVHGACVRDGSWWWHRTAAELRGHGVESVAPKLASCGESGPVGGLAEDVAAVREVLQADDAPTIVVAHSYGGIVTAEAAAGITSVRHLLLVSSYLPEVGQSLSDFGDGNPAPFLEVRDGRFGVRPELLVDTFLQDCDPLVQNEAPEHLAWQNVQVTGQPVAAAAWQQLPTTYLVCAQDRGTPAGLQRQYAARADRVVEFDAGHHPFLSRPAEVSDLVLSLWRSPLCERGSASQEG